MIAQWQEEEVRRHAFAGAHIFYFENCVEDVILHELQVKPFYASILKKGKKSAPPTRRHSLVVAALAREMKQSAQTPKRATTDPNKLYLDSAATYHSMFCTRLLQNVRNAGKTIRGNCNAGVNLSTKIGDLGVFKMWVNEGG